MSPEERTTKHEYNLRYVSTHTALTWANTLLNNLLHSEFGLSFFMTEEYNVFLHH
jgi:trehalose-6-phosphate synthase